MVPGRSDSPDTAALFRPRPPRRRRRGGGGSPLESSSPLAGVPVLALDALSTLRRQCARRRSSGCATPPSLRLLTPLLASLLAPAAAPHPPGVRS